MVQWLEHRSRILKTYIQVSALASCRTLEKDSVTCPPQLLMFNKTQECCRDKYTEDWEVLKYYSNGGHLGVAEKERKRDKVWDFSCSSFSSPYTVKSNILTDSMFYGKSKYSLT